jgi:hypothetical protein
VTGMLVVVPTRRPVLKAEVQDGSYDNAHPLLVRHGRIARY